MRSKNLFGVLSATAAALSIALVLGECARVGYAGQIIAIDDFDGPAGQSGFFLGTPGDLLHLSQTSHSGILGGQRDALVKVDGPADSPVAAYCIIGPQTGQTNGFFLLGSVSESCGTSVKLQYDGEDTESGDDLDDALGLGGAALGVDLRDGTNTDFVFGFRFADHLIDLSITVNRKDLSDQEVGRATYVGTLPQYTDPTDHYVGFDQFDISGLDPFGSAASITIEFNNPASPGAPVPNVDFKLDYILAGPNPIPEPSTFTLLGVGVLLFAAGRYRRLRRTATGGGRQ